MLVVSSNTSNTGGGLQGLSGCRVDSHSELSRVSSGETLWRDVGFVAIGTKSFSTARWTGFKTAKSNTSTKQYSQSFPGWKRLLALLRGSCNPWPPPTVLHETIFQVDQAEKGKVPHRTVGLSCSV